MNIKYSIQTILFIFCFINSIYCEQNQLSMRAKYSKISDPEELIIPSHLGAGFFAELHKVVDNILYFENDNLQNIFVDWTQEFFPYKDDPYSNGWGLYFELIKYNQPGNDLKKIGSGCSMHMLHEQNCTARWIEYQRYFPYRLAVHDKIKECIQIKKDILEEVDDCYQNYLEGFYSIGVHLRYASAHAAEVPGRLSIEDYVNEVSRLIEIYNNEDWKIFLATDSKYVIKIFLDTFSTEKVFYINACRSEYREEPHLIYENADYWLAHSQEFHKKKPGYWGGRTTLIDCLLLSKCNILIHTASNLADFATFFNPYIPTIFLPKNVSSKPCAYPNRLFPKIDSIDESN